MDEDLWSNCERKILIPPVAIVLSRSISVRYHVTSTIDICRVAGVATLNTGLPMVSVAWPFRHGENLNIGTYTVSLFFIRPPFISKINFVQLQAWTAVSCITFSLENNAVGKISISDPPGKWESEATNISFEHLTFLDIAAV